MKVKVRKVEPTAADFELKELRDKIPPIAGVDFDEFSDYYWYLIKNKRELEILNEEYESADIKVDVFPAVICVECFGNDFGEGRYWYNIQEAFKIFERFMSELYCAISNHCNR